MIVETGKPDIPFVINQLLNAGALPVVGLIIGGYSKSRQ